MAIQGFFTGDVKIRDLNGVLKAVDGIVEVATDAGTVTSVGIQVGSTGTDVNVANSPVTTSGNITLNLPTASATNRGLLSSADWAIFDAKQGSITLTTTGNNGSATLTSGTLNIPTYTLAGLGGISLTSLSASSPLIYDNTTGAFSIQVANGSQDGYLSSSDWTTFNSKQSALTFSSPLVNTAGTVSIPAATSSVNGYLTSADWITFNAKQGAITLTTTGSSGAATLIGTTLNIPNYSGALTGYVPYTGATTNVNLGEFGITSGYYGFDLTPTNTPTTQGTVYWDDSHSTLSLIMNGVTQHIGQDSFFYVKNSTGSSIPKGTSVMFNGTDGASGHLLIAPFLADGTYPSSYFMGVTAETIGNGGFGQVVNFGELEGIDTSVYTAGDLLYASSTVAGGFQTTAPSAPNNIVLIAAAVNSKNNGTIVVRPTYGSNINDDEGVLITSAANNQGLFYDSATGLWKNKSIATVLGYTPANAATTLTINGTAYDLSANRTWNVGTVTSIGTSGPLTGGTITGSGTIGITQATTSTDGYLSSTDWNTFNNKQAAGSYITALTGEATATGPGSASVTLSTSAVTGKLLTGLNLTGGGTIADTDSILQAFGKVQNQISGMVGGVTYQGVWNASTNTPTLTSSVGTKGYYYIVDVAGSTNLNGITDWKVGDWAIFNGSTWDKVDNTDAVSSVNGFTGAVSLTTSNIAEGTNLYYLDSRARLALSFTAGSGAYDNTTGVITIPTNTSQLTNGANYITLSSLSASSPLSYNSGTGAFSIQVANGSQNGYLSSTDWTTFNSKQNAITLTTTGSSGSSTLVGATLNVPTYTLSGLGGVPTSRQLTINGTAYDLSADRSWSVGTHTGSLTSGYIPKATGTTSLTDSLVYDTGSAVLIGTQTASSGKFTVYSSTADNHYQAIGSAPSFRFADTLTSPTYTGIIGLATASNHFIVGAAAGDMVLANNTTSSLGNFIFGTGTTERMRITPTGNVSINNTNNTYRFDVTGTVRFTGQLRLESTITDGTYTYTLPGATGTLALVGGAGVGTVTSIATTGPITGGTITSTGTIGITQATSSTDGYLSSTDWTTFNNKQSALTNPITGTGTTNYLPKFTGTSTIGNSAVQDDGTNILTSLAYKSTANSNTFGNASLSGRALIIQSGSANQAIMFKNAAGGDATLYVTGTSTSVNYQFDTYSVGGALTLTNSGNLGLGVNPSAMSAVSGIELVQGSQIASRILANVPQLYISSNIAGDSYAPTYKVNGYATQYRLQGYDGTHAWYIAPSGTAGNAISFTQAMTLNASGNLSVGNTNDTYKLDVSGTGIFRKAGDSRLIIYETGAAPYTATLELSSQAIGTYGATMQYTSDAENLTIETYGRTTSGTTQGDINFRTKVGNTTPTNVLNLDGFTGAATFSSSVTAGGDVTLSGNESYLYFTSTYSVGSNTRAKIRTVGAGGGSGYGGDLRFSTRNSSNVWNEDAMTINSVGFVGIGTTSPATALHVYNASQGVARFESTQGEVNIALNNSSASGNLIGTVGANFYFYSGGSEKVRINASGNLSIGNTNDTYKLDVSGTGRFNGTSASPLLYLTNTTGGTTTDFTITENVGLIINSYEGASARSIDLRVGGTSALSIASTGAATFSSSGQFGGTLSSQVANGGGDGGILFVKNSAGATLNSTAVLAFATDAGGSATNNPRIQAILKNTGDGASDLEFFVHSGAGVINKAFTLFRDSSATFSSSVTAATESNFTGTSVNSRILVTASGVANTVLGFNNSGSTATGVSNNTGYVGLLQAYPLAFITDSVERMRITSGGSLLVGTTSELQSATSKLNIAGDFYNANGVSLKTTNGGSGSQFVGFINESGTLIGSINRVTTTNAVAYNTTSDYRLKEDLKSINGLEIVNKIKVYDYKWKSDNSRMDGVLAHELAEVLPYAVTGIKDGEKMQQVDYSKIVPVLIQSVKELKSELDTLKNK